MSSYTRSISGDFSGVTPNIDQLTIEITQDAAITKTLDGITVSGNDVIFEFTEALSVDDETALDALISGYVLNIPPDINQYNIIATSNPTVNHDALHGYEIGARWTNSTTKREFNLIDNTTGASIWKNIADKGYDAIVDITGNGDYDSIPAAFASGAKSIFLRAGTYVTLSDVVVPDGGVIMGEGPARPIVYFAVPGTGIKIDGNNGVKESAGTISITSGTTTVTGTGTTFTNLTTGQFILLGQTFYEIAAINSDTEIIIADTYYGNTLSSYTYQAHAIYSGVSISNFIVMNSTTHGLFMRANRHSVINSLAFKDCTTSVCLEDNSSCALESVASQNSVQSGIAINSCYAIGVESVTAFNSQTHGIEIKGTSKNIIVSECQASNNQQHGVMITDTSETVILTDGITKHNKLDGIHIDTNAIRCNITDGTSSHNGSDGVHIDGSGCTLQGIIIGNNTTHGIYMTNSNTSSCNQLFNNGDVGMNVTGNYCNLTGNIVDSNGSHGFSIAGDKNVITGNTVKNNSTDGIRIAGGDNNIINGNGIYSNTGCGIFATSTCLKSQFICNNIDGHTYGIDVDSSCADCSIGLNTVTGASNDGILCAADTTIVCANRCTGNTGYGLHITSDANTTVEFANMLAGNTAGPILDEGTIPIVNPIKGIYIAKSDNLIPSTQTTMSGSYVTFQKFIYDGYLNNHKPTEIKIIARMDGGATAYSARIQDLTNSLTICEVTGQTNTSDAIINLGTVSNVPVTEAQFALQMHVDGGIGSCYCENILIKYY